MGEEEGRGYEYPISPTQYVSIAYTVCISKSDLCNVVYISTSILRTEHDAPAL